MIEVTDNHAHANPLKGLGFVEVTKRFMMSGGVAIVFAPLPSWYYSVSVTSPESYSRIYDIVIKGVQEASAYIKTLAVLGIHPAEVVRLVEAFGARRALEVAEGAMRKAARYVAEGLAVGLGEVGRPHYDTSKISLEVCNRILDVSLELAKDLDCPIHLHLERRSHAVKDVVARVRKVGLKPYRVVIHHAESKIIGESGRLTPSIPRRGRNLREAFTKRATFLVESDFIDDPNRPGVVSYPWAIATEVLEMLSSNLVSKDHIRKVFIDSFEEVYDIKLH
ncbi:MAG: TatD family hydrolase [Candidatus Nezhaarchaeales archaeon]